MTTSTVRAELLEDSILASISEPAGEFRYMARQPVLDRRSKVQAYELLFCNGHEPAVGAETEAATRRMLDQTLLAGVEQLACGLPAFVKCTVGSLAEEWVRMLPPAMTVVELPSDSEPTPSLIAACEQLKAMGFRLALDDFTVKVVSKSLLDLADYIKVDLAKVDVGERRKLLRALDGASAQLVAKNVETQAEFRDAGVEGFTLFQGYYFCHPEPLKSHKIPGNWLVHLEILEDLQKDPVDLPRLSQLVMCDASLTYRLLRLVNSPVCAVRQEVTSIQTALMLVGEATFRRIAMLAIASDFNTDQPPEILRMAFERGRFCELVAPLFGLDPNEQYLIGMVSLFPAMLRLLMEDMVRLLPLREAARGALMDKGNPEGIPLRWLKCHEHGDWAACDAIIAPKGLRPNQLTQCHAEAVRWAESTIKSTAKDSRA